MLRRENHNSDTWMWMYFTDEKKFPHKRNECCGEIQGAEKVNKCFIYQIPVSHDKTITLHLVLYQQQ